MYQPQFLNPNIRQFPFDSASGQIVRELEKRNWQVPGVKVEFHEYGSGTQKFRYVSKITSQEFKIRFAREQGPLPGDFNDIAAVAEIVIPKHEIQVYADDSGPTFYLYVGNDYERDREKFMGSIKVNSKLRGETKMYLKYKGECRCTGYGLPHHHQGLRPPLLAHDNDGGREYDPKGDEPKLLRTTKVLRMFRRYLEDVVLKMVVSHPIPTEKVEILSAPESIPFPESVGSIFCFGEYGDAERIKQGKVNEEMLNPSDRYGLPKGGYRLLSWFVSNDGTVPEIAYEGFRWCGIGEVTAKTPINWLDVPGHYRYSDRERFVISVKPNRANSIYIADHAQYEKRRKEIGGSLGDRENFTDAEVADFNCARARTIVPISEYQGGYEQPIVLINRELSFDEVEVVSGPHPDRLGY